MARGNGAAGCLEAKAGTRGGAVPTFAAEFSRLAHELARRRRFVLTTHIRPDGDALGSAIALKLILEAAGADVYLWHAEGDPYGFDTLALPGVRWHSGCPVDIESRTAVILDCATRERAAAGDELESALSVLQLDHHASNPRFAAINAVGADAPSTTFLIAGLADKLGVAITPEIALPLYYGLWTDTGGFRYANATPEAHAMRARLAACLGPERYDALEAEFNNVPESFRAYAARGDEARRVIAPEVLFVALGQDDCAASEVDPQDQKSANDEVLNVIQERPARLHALWYEMADGTRSVSLRCQSKRVDCAALALSFGGGGHTAAAGFTTTDDRDTVAAAIALWVAKTYDA